VGRGERGYPLPTGGRVWVEGRAPPQKIFRIFVEKYHILTHSDTLISQIIRQWEEF